MCQRARLSLFKAVGSKTLQFTMSSHELTSNGRYHENRTRNGLRSDSGIILVCPATKGTQGRLWQRGHSSDSHDSSFGEDGGSASVGLRRSQSSSKQGQMEIMLLEVRFPRL